MAKKDLWVTVLVLLLAGAVNAQVDRRPAANGQKERAESRKSEGIRQHAEDKSDGAAFSGRGRGGDKNLRDKEHRKGKKGRKGHKKHAGPRHEGRHADEGSAPSPQTRPGAGGSKEPAPTPPRRPGERPTSGAEPKNLPRRQ
ncbi:MAG: hypothetical protein RMJ33_09545 [Saprospiraceae bacterium]|nr:hypothetical protein [Saprospiraceae bacterium]MDW8230068.1 hypothetical protein [Saprospiraceae bacterium]